MLLSFFLAKFLGIYFLIVAALWLLRKEQFDKLISEIISSPALVGLSGILSLIFGIAIVVAHSVWVWGWPLAITLIGYIGIVQGIVRVGFPATFQKMASGIMHCCHWIPLGILALLGAYLTYCGFFGSLLS